MPSATTGSNVVNSSQVLTPLKLDALTGADDEGYLAGLKSQIKIPQAMRDEFT
jgi:hypothetical protein